MFYAAAGGIVNELNNQYPDALATDKSIINMGFWPGGDRDGNPFVTADITMRVAAALKGSIIKCYYQDIRRLKRRLTFKGIDVILNGLEKQLYDNIFIPGVDSTITKRDIIEELEKVKTMIIYNHSGLFLQLVCDLINKINIFGLHFASLDVRQESSVHNSVLINLYGNVYEALSVKEKTNFLCNLSENSKVINN